MEACFFYRQTLDPMSWWVYANKRWALIGWIVAPLETPPTDVPFDDHHLSSGTSSVTLCQQITKTKESQSDGQVGQMMYYFNWNLRSAIELYTLWVPEETGINLDIYFRKFTFFAYHLIRSLKLINRPNAALSLVNHSLATMISWGGCSWEIIIRGVIFWWSCKQVSFNLNLFAYLAVVVAVADSGTKMIVVMHNAWSVLIRRGLWFYGLNFALYFQRIILSIIFRVQATLSFLVSNLQQFLRCYATL